MTASSWKCGNCESLNPITADVCETCSLLREPDELAGAGHLRHLMASLTNSGAWRIASVGPGYVEIAARSRADAEARGKELLDQDAYADQSVTVTSARTRGWLVYVRSRLTPYPTSLNAREAAAPPKRPSDFSPAAKPPIEGRMYLGRVVAWFDDKGYGTIACANRAIGDVSVQRSGLANPKAAVLRAGQNVCFYIEQTPGGPFAIDVMAL